MNLPFVVIGGGLAGVSCARNLSRLNPERKVVLISTSDLLKDVTKVTYVTEAIMNYDVEEIPFEKLAKEHGNVEVRPGLTCVGIDINAKCVRLESLASGEITHVSYFKLCICSGASPNLISQNSYCIGVRDTQSIDEMAKAIKVARRIVLVGNGALASEILYAVRATCEIVWVTKNKYLGNTFYDANVSGFLLAGLSSKPKKTHDKPGLENPWADGALFKKREGKYNSALGPNWGERLREACGWSDSLQEEKLEGIVKSLCARLVWEKNVTVEDISSTGSSGKQDFPVQVRLSSNKTYGADLIISATGVIPCCNFFNKALLKLKKDDGGLCVDRNMKAIGVEDIYAAGDVCYAEPSYARSGKTNLWFQMRLWGQAYEMGKKAAYSMSGLQDEILPGFLFEIFTHSTSLFGRKVVLLGAFNGQGLDKESQNLIVNKKFDTPVEMYIDPKNRNPPCAIFEETVIPEKVKVLVRMIPSIEYIKLVLVSGKIVGAMLVGDTDLEETFENLILNELDVSKYGYNLLNPCIDIEDYFD